IRCISLPEQAVKEISYRWPLTPGLGGWRSRFSAVVRVRRPSYEFQLLTWPTTQLQRKSDIKDECLAQVRTSDIHSADISDSMSARPPVSQPPSALPLASLDHFFGSHHHHWWNR